MTAREWYVDYYEEEDGSSPVEEYIEAHEVQVRARARRLLLLLTEFGPEMASEAGRKYCRKVKGHKELGHIRVECRPRARGEDCPDLGMLFCAKRDGTFVVVHAYEWKSWTVPEHAARVASERARNEGCVGVWWEVQGEAR
ncbi:MAG: hypothetical protein E3J64_01460 [Anaerolineales bacterium]|nr:MAG: hypothetical protein E3J64_01460 [Anaerolineales bacterium]